MSYSLNSLKGITWGTIGFCILGVILRGIQGVWTIAPIILYIITVSISCSIVSRFPFHCPFSFSFDSPLLRGIQGLQTITPTILYMITVSMSFFIVFSIWFSIIKGDTGSLDYSSLRVLGAQVGARLKVQS